MAYKDPEKARAAWRRAEAKKKAKRDASPELHEEFKQHRKEYKRKLRAMKPGYKPKLGEGRVPWKLWPEEKKNDVRKKIKAYRLTLEGTTSEVKNWLSRKGVLDQVDDSYVKAIAMIRMIKREIKRGKSK